MPFKIIAMDVGEGQAILLQRGDRGILIDTGHAGVASHVVVKLNHYGVSNLDYLILTHLHPDHASGYFRIKEAFPNTPVLTHNFPFANSIRAPDISRWVAEALKIDRNHQTIRRGLKLVWQHVEINTLWPGNKAGNNMNDSSLVIEVVFGNRRSLLMGDVGQRVEELLIKKSFLNKNYDVLVAGHHGSKNSSSEIFLQQVSPQFSLISTNVDNLRGYPDAATENRLERYSRQKVLRTYAEGDLCFEWSSGSKPPQQC